MGGSTQCFSIEGEGSVSEASSRHPAARRHDAASEPRYPRIRSDSVAGLTFWGPYGSFDPASARRGHGVSDESVMHGGCSLDVRRDDDSMFSEVLEKRVSCPTALGFHDVEGHSPKQVL